MTGTNAIATVALILHSLSAVVWVGGMFFARQALRPAAAVLEAGPRLMLWSQTLRRFFAWVIASIVLLLASGLVMIFAVFGGFQPDRSAYPADDGDRHFDDAVVLPPLFCAVAPVRRRGGAAGLGRGRTAALPDPHDRHDQPRCRPHRRRDRQQRPLLGLKTNALRSGGGLSGAVTPAAKSSKQ